LPGRPGFFIPFLRLFYSFSYCIAVRLKNNELNAVLLFKKTDEEEKEVAGYLKIRIFS
jgi:hypothetical protein